MPTRSSMDRLPYRFCDDVISLLSSPLYLAETKGTWSAVAQRHSLHRVSYEFFLIRDDALNSWRYRFEGCGRNHSLSDLLSINWRYVRVQNAVFLRDHSTDQNIEISSSHLFSSLLPFVSAQLVHNSQFHLYLFGLDREVAFRILRIFDQKCQLSTISLPYFKDVSEEFLRSHTEAGGAAEVHFLDYWPESTKDFFLNYVKNTTSPVVNLPSDLQFDIEVLDVLWLDQTKDRSVSFASTISEDQLREYHNDLLTEQHERFVWRTPYGQFSAYLGVRGLFVKTTPTLIDVE
ncbi:hypothetical protein QR680_012208 [Steinernema hermaphroditum]|uniref:F-box domain-containing protein n=1 Tax=Steinernema hermaphroditum TaxID=289476 RepID=A0AA39I1A9_9BILA|nr:hypothetical protein QR680_012208 [Steinernema hermaphroditum]